MQVSDLVHFLSYPLPFLGVVALLVFVHEAGHYLMARLCGVRVEVFSIGVGRELFGRTDRRGTRWKVSIFPIGGYVKMDEGPDGFSMRPLIARTLVMLAGPAANFLFTIVVFAVFFMTAGQKITIPMVGSVSPGTPAEQAGIKPGDRIVTIDGAPVHRWEDLREAILIHPGDPLSLRLDRDGEQLTVEVTPTVFDAPGLDGKISREVRIGVHHAGMPELVRQPPGRAVAQACRETGWLIQGTVMSILQMIDGRRPPERKNGVVSVAQATHATAGRGLGDLIHLSAFLSTSLGLTNLFPIPMLDGGYILLFGVEAVMRRPPSEAVLKYSFRFGLSLVLALALLALWNDLAGLGVFDFVHTHFSWRAGETSPPPRRGQSSVLCSPGHDAKAAW